LSLGRELNTGLPSYEPAAYYEPLSVRWAAYILGGRKLRASKHGQTDGH